MGCGVCEYPLSSPPFADVMTITPYHTPYPVSFCYSPDFTPLSFSSSAPVCIATVCIATVVRQSIFNNENRTLGEFRRKLAALIAKKKAKMAKLQKQLTVLKTALASPDAPLSDLFPLIGAHYQEFTKVCTNFASTSAEGKAALQEMLQVLAEPVDDKSTAGAAGAAAGSEAEVSVAQ